MQQPKKRLSSQQKEINCLTQSNHILMKENQFLRIQLAKLTNQSNYSQHDDYISPFLSDNIIIPNTDVFPFYNSFTPFTITLDLATMPGFKTMSSREIGDYLHIRLQKLHNKYKKDNFLTYYCLEHTQIGTPHFHGFTTLIKDDINCLKEHFTKDINNPRTILFFTHGRLNMDHGYHVYINKPCPYDLPKYWGLIKSNNFIAEDDPNITPATTYRIIITDDMKQTLVSHVPGKEPQKCPTCKYNYI